MSMILTVPIFKNSPSNGASWQTLKLWKNKIRALYKSFFQCLEVCHEAPFDWKFLKIGSVGIIKNVSSTYLDKSRLARFSLTGGYILIMILKIIFSILPFNSNPRPASFHLSPSSVLFVFLIKDHIILTCVTSRFANPVPDLGTVE